MKAILQGIYHTALFIGAYVGLIVGVGLGLMIIGALFGF